MIENMFYENQVVNALYKGNMKLWEKPKNTPKSSLSLGVIGDSTIAAGYGGQLVPSYIAEFTPITSVAKPGDTILGQRAKWDALTNYHDFDVVILQIGLNDMDADLQTTSTVLSNYQALVNKVRADIRSDCKIYVSKMLPCRQRYINYFGEAKGLLAQQRWIDLNNAIAGKGSNAITNVDGRINEHVSILGDASGNLKVEYDTGDHIHENPAGRQVIANAWKNKMLIDSLLIS